MLLWSFFSLYLFFPPFAYQRNALGHNVIHALSLSFPYKQYFLWQCGPLYNVAFGHDDWWNSQVWITGFELQAVGGKLYKVTMSEALQWKKKKPLKWASSWGVFPRQGIGNLSATICPALSFKMSLFLIFFFFYTNSIIVGCHDDLIRFSHWGIIGWPMEMVLLVKWNWSQHSEVIRP